MDVLPPIENLSDDGSEEAQPGSSTDSRPLKRARPDQVPKSRVQVKAELHKVLARTCECAKYRKRGNQDSCFQPYRAPASLDSVVALRLELQSLHKQDADNKAILTDRISLKHECTLLLLFFTNLKWFCSRKSRLGDCAHWDWRTAPVLVWPSGLSASLQSHSWLGFCEVETIEKVCYRRHLCTNRWQNPSTEGCASEPQKSWTQTADSRVLARDLWIALWTDAGNQRKNSWREKACFPTEQGKAAARSRASSQVDESIRNSYRVSRVWAHANAAAWNFHRISRHVEVPAPWQEDFPEALQFGYLVIT